MERDERRTWRREGNGQRLERVLTGGLTRSAEASGLRRTRTRHPWGRAHEHANTISRCLSLCRLGLRARVGPRVSSFRGVRNWTDLGEGEKIWICVAIYLERTQSRGMFTGNRNPTRVIVVRLPKVESHHTQSMLYFRIRFELSASLLEAIQDHPDLWVQHNPLRRVCPSRGEWSRSPSGTRTSPECIRWVEDPPWIPEVLRAWSGWTRLDSSRLAHPERTSERSPPERSPLPDSRIEPSTS